MFDCASQCLYLLQVFFCLNQILPKFKKEKQRLQEHHVLKQMYIIKKIWGFPGGAVVENLPANAGDTGSSPGLGRFPHATEQLGP